MPSNDPALVADILKATHLTGDEVVDIPKLGTRPIGEALAHTLQITKLSRKLVEAYAKAGDLAQLKGLLQPEQQSHLDTYLYDRGPIDLLTEHPGVITSAQQLAGLLPKLAPRLYSISSSPKAHAGEVHATVAVVRYRAHNRERGGVCSTLFADRTDLHGTLPVYIQHNKKFRLPADSAAPIIMIGPGTGIAPFRGFLHERCATAATGKNWLFFGDRCAATDFLYRDELDQMTGSGLLTRLTRRFSRPGAQDLRAGPHARARRGVLCLAPAGRNHLRLRRRLAHGQGRRRGAAPVIDPARQHATPQAYVQDLHDTTATTATSTRPPCPHARMRHLVPSRISRARSRRHKPGPRAPDRPHARRQGSSSRKVVSSAHPLAPLGPGEQYRFHFDMTKCIGCRSCEVACNEQNNNPADILWRRIGELEAGSYPDTQRHYLSMGCNHCLDADCLKGCPVDAYTKDPVTGIVLHSADACIGCSYCVWNCPYSVPQFNPERGVVGKCDMCKGRLDEGLEPACVNACPRARSRSSSST